MKIASYYLNNEDNGDGKAKKKLTSGEYQTYVTKPSFHSKTNSIQSSRDRSWAAQRTCGAAKADSKNQGEHESWTRWTKTRLVCFLVKGWVKVDAKGLVGIELTYRYQGHRKKSRWLAVISCGVIALTMKPLFAHEGRWWLNRTHTGNHTISMAWIKQP